MNEYMRGPGGYDAMYYWEQFHPILSAVAILLIGWVIALLVSAGVKKSCKSLAPMSGLTMRLAIVPILKISSQELSSG